jgi:release factor glutamine methyltransferase
MQIGKLLENSAADPTEAEILLAELLNKDRSFIKAHQDLKLNKENTLKANNLIERRLKKEPLFYILGYKEFCGLRFRVDSRAMIPRPETEELVACVLSHVYALSNRQRPNHFNAKNLIIVDVGAGCGNIAVSLAKAIPFAKIYAIEKDKQALALAKENINHFKLEKQINIIHGDLLKPLTEKVDIIVANLPYIPSSKLDSLQPEIINWEPKAALDGGTDGLEIYRRLFKDAPRVLRRDGYIFYEIDGTPLIQRF